MAQLQMYKWAIGMLLALLVTMGSFSYTQLNDRVQTNVIMMGKLTESVAVLIQVQSQDSEQRKLILEEIRLIALKTNKNHDEIVLIKARSLQFETQKMTQQILKDLELLIGGLVFRYQEERKANK